MTTYPIWQTIPDRARAIPCAVSTLRAWYEGGKHPKPAKIGGAVRFYGPDLKAWDEQQAAIARGAVALADLV